MNALQENQKGEVIKVLQSDGCTNTNIWFRYVGDKPEQLSRIEALKMRFLRSVTGCTRQDRLYNEEIHRELKIFQTKDRIKENRQRWMRQLGRMDIYPRKFVGTSQ